MALALALGDVIRDVTMGEKHTLARVTWESSERLGVQMRVSGWIFRSWKYRICIREIIKIIFRRIRSSVEIRRGSNRLMMRRGVMLGEIIGAICCTLAPIDAKLILAHAIANPV